MINLICFSFGVLVFTYEIIHIGFRVVFQYSGWFLVYTSLLHLYQVLFTIPSFIAYTAFIIGIVIVLPASIPSLMTFNETFTSYLLYDLGNHVFLPLCTIFHLNKTTYTRISKSIILLLIYNTVWVLVVEFLSDTFPYEILNTISLEYRILFYISITMLGVLGLLTLSITPCISVNQTIRV